MGSRRREIRLRDSSDLGQESTGEIGDFKLAFWRPGSTTADFRGFLDL